MKKRTCKKLRFLSRTISLLLILALLTQDALGSGSITLAAMRQEEIEATENSQDTGPEPGEETADIAEDSEDADRSEEAQGDEVLSEDEEPQILFEVEFLREQNEKHYRLSDGTIMAAEYGMDVHYETEDGSWGDIDNRFRYEAANRTDDMEGYATAEGPVEFKFAPDADGEVVRAVNGEYSVSFELVEDVTVEMQSPAGLSAETQELKPEASAGQSEEEPAEQPETENIVEEATVSNGRSSVTASPITFLKGEILNEEDVPVSEEGAGNGSIASSWPLSEESSTAEVAREASPADTSVQERTVWAEDWDETSAAEESLVEQATLDNVVTSVGYENVLPGTSLQYVTYGSSLKEYILVRAKQDSYHYTFAMDLEGLVPQMQEDNSILLKDVQSGEVIYEIPAAYMTDAAGAYSDAVTMTLTGSEDGTYLLGIEADAKWINAADRTFPVQIDPTLNARLSSSTGIRGNYVCQGRPTTSNINYGEMFVGYDSSGNKKMITYIQLRNLPALPEDSIICGAVFNMAVLSYSQVATPTMHVQAKEVKEEITWSSRYTWNTRPETSSIVLDQQAITSSSLYAYVGWNITELVKKHYKEGNIADDILAFALEAEGTMYNLKCANAALNYSWSGAEPILQVMYRDTRGIEGYYTYQTQDIGNAGTAYVSDYTSQLTVIKPVGSYNNTIMPYELGLVYNSSYSDRYFSNDKVNAADIYTKDFSTMYIGAGWKLTAQETIVEVPVTDLEGTTTYLVHIDGDGTAHYFHKSEKNNTVYEDEDGLNLTISKNGNNYVMVDKKDNKKCFTNGYLTTIEDANGNAVHILYNGSSVTNNVVHLSAPNYISSIVAAPNDCHPSNYFMLDSSH